MAEIFRTRVWATLASGIGTGATSVALTSGHGARIGAIGAGEFIRAVGITSSGQIEDLTITGRSTDTLTITRSGSPLSFLAGDRIECRINDLSMAGLAQVNHLQSNEKRYAIAGGTADALTAALPASDVAALVDGMEIDAQVPGPNTVIAPTLKALLNGGTVDTGAITIVKGSNAALVAGDLVGRHTFSYSGALSKWVVKDPAKGAAAAADSDRWAGAAKTISNAAPSGGADGDVWFQY